MAKEPEQPQRCPTCDSPDPAKHPAMQFEGEVQPCRDKWHPPLPEQSPAALRHSHGPPEEQEAAEAFMADMGVSCNHMGMHSHRWPSDKTSVYSHHHHDLRCLFQAGANLKERELTRKERELTRLQQELAESEADLKATKGALRLAGGLLRAYEEGAAQDRSKIETLHQMADTANGALGLAIAFMTLTPSKGPYRTVKEDYDQWRRSSSSGVQLFHMRQKVRGKN